METKKTFTEWTHFIAIFGVIIACLALGTGLIMLLLSAVEPRQGYGVFAAILLGSGFGALLMSCVAGTVAEIGLRHQRKTPVKNAVQKPRKITSFDKAMLDFDE